jgi:HD-like signal output (HDOD) protein
MGKPMITRTLEKNENLNLPQKVRRTKIKIDKDFEMPSIPAVLTKILGLIDGNQATARQLEEIILHDPSLSARILSLANSAFYAFRSEVKTISHAIALLGLNLVKSLAIGVSIFESFTVGLKKEASLINQLWMHSFGVGALAQEIWRPRTDRVEAEFAFLCGLSNRRRIETSAATISNAMSQPMRRSGPCWRANGSCLKISLP